MINGSFTSHIEAPLKKVWQILLDRAEHPENYAGGPPASTIKERSTDGFVRELQYGKRSVTERVSIDNQAHRIVFEVLGHKVLRGSVNHAIINERPDGGVTVAFTMDYSIIPPATENQVPNLRSDIESSLVDVKRKAEAGWPLRHRDSDDLLEHNQLGVSVSVGAGHTSEEEDPSAVPIGMGVPAEVPEPL